MNRKKYWAILLNPISLFVYYIWLRILYRFLAYGGVSRRVPILLALGLAGIVWILAWTIVYFFQRKKDINNTDEAVQAAKQPGKWIRIVLTIELSIAIGMTGLYGYRIIQAAQPFGGKLGNYIWEKQNSSEVPLVHNNFNKDGLDGIISDLDDKLSLPKELYVANYVSVDYEKDGSITGIYAFFYGRDKDGDLKTYLVDFDASKSKKMTVWLDGNANADFQDAEKLNQMKRTITQRQDGTYQAKWNPDKALLQAKPDEPEGNKHKSGDLITDEAGGLHFYLDGNTQYTLTVTDAAAGSRAYAFSGKGVYNQDPFHGSIGVAEDMHFKDAMHGWILLNNASGDHPRTYITKDGGKTFSLKK